MSKPVQAVLFDVGNVVLRLRMDEFFSKVAQASPALSPSVMDELLKQSGGWHHRFERGEIEFDDFYAGLNKDHGLTMEKEAFRQAWRAYFALNETMALLIERLHSQLPLWVLSNTNAEHFDVFVADFPVFKHFKEVVGSHHLGHRKPEVAAFEAVLKRMKLAGDQVFFVDDLKANIESAQSLGMRTYHYAFDDEGLWQALEAAGLDLGALRAGEP